MVAGLATAPFALYHFNRFALYGVAANLIAVPLTGLWIMPWAIAAFAMMPFGLEALAPAPMGWGMDAVLAVAEIVLGTQKEEGESGERENDERHADYRPARRNSQAEPRAKNARCNGKCHRENSDSGDDVGQKN